jgi:hypothetical protein
MSDAPSPRAKPTPVQPVRPLPDERRPARIATERRWTNALIAGAGAVASAFVVAMLSATDGHFVPQVVDLYVVCQYARAMAEGHPFQYNPGEPPSTGATSVLYTAWLALGHALGARGEALIAFAIATGAALYVMACAVALGLGQRLAGEREGWLAGALVALGGPVVWAFLYGSDIALFMFLALWLLERMVTAWTTGALGSAALVAALISLARPEGLLIAIAFGIACSLRFRGRRPWLIAWAPAAAALTVVLALRLLTGAWLGSSLSDKSLVASYGVAATIGVVAEYATDVIRGLLLGFYPSQSPVGFSRGWASLYFPPLGLLLVVAALLATPRAAARPAARWWAGTAAVTVLALAPNLFLGVHFNRYLLWAIPGLLVMAAAGLGVAARWIASGDAPLERSLFRAGAALMLVLGALSTARFAVAYGDMAGEVYRRDVAAAQWIGRHLPAGVAIANLATSVEYLTGHRNLNLHGVTTPAFFGGRATERDAGALAGLRRLEVGERPAYLMVMASTASASPLARALIEGPALFASSTGGDELLIHRIRYDLLDAARAHRSARAAEATAGLRRVDMLDIGDPRDEAAHAYRADSSLAGAQLAASVRVAPYAAGPVVADAGRAVLGSESFDLKTVPARDLILVLRTCAELETALVRIGGSAVTIGFDPAGVDVRLGGRSAARMEATPATGWDEWILRVPGAAITSEKTRVELAGRFASFGYWAYQ